MYAAVALCQQRLLRKAARKHRPYAAVKQPARRKACRIRNVPSAAWRALCRRTVKKCARPADAAAAQPEGEVSDPQPETALTGLIGGITGNPALITGSGTETDPGQISTADQLKLFRILSTVRAARRRTVARMLC